MWSFWQSILKSRILDDQIDQDTISNKCEVTLLHHLLSSLFFPLFIKQFFCILFRLDADPMEVSHYLKESWLEHLTWKCTHYGVPQTKGFALSSLIRKFMSVVIRHQSNRVYDGDIVCLLEESKGTYDQLVGNGRRTEAKNKRKWNREEGAFQSQLSTFSPCVSSLIVYSLVCSSRKKILLLCFFTMMGLWMTGMISNGAAVLYMFLHSIRQSGKSIVCCLCTSPNAFRDWNLVLQ